MSAYAGDIETLPVVAIDETGNTGENLLDATQPTFAIAAIHLDADVAREIVEAQLAEDQEELHFVKLRKSPRGRQQVLDVLSDSSLDPDRARVSVMHKPWATAGKIIDLLFEPVVYAVAGDLYAEDNHIKLLTYIASTGPGACGDAEWHELLESFIGIVRGAAELDLYRYQAALGMCRATCNDEFLCELLEMLPDTNQGIADVRPRDADPLDLLDPTVGVAYEQAHEWSGRLGWFVLKHDHSVVLERIGARMLAISDPAEAAKLDVSPTARLQPLKLAAIRPCDSHDVPAIQIADLVAGACRAWLNAWLGLPSDERFVAAIETTGVLRLMQHFMWPPDVSLAERLDSLEDG